LDIIVINIFSSLLIVNINAQTTDSIVIAGTELHKSFDGKWGYSKKYVDEQKHIVIQCKYDEVTNFKYDVGDYK